MTGEDVATGVGIVFSKRGEVRIRWHGKVKMAKMPMVGDLI